MKCKVCGVRAYSDFCFRHKPRKPIKVNKLPAKRGKQHYKYETWKNTVAIPYLDARYGHICHALGCPSTKVDVDHIKTRGGHQELKYELTNVRYLCRPHHRMVTDGEKVEMKHERLSPSSSL